MREEGRRWARKQVLQSADFALAAKEVKKLLKGFQYCLVGGLAVSVYANPPVTVDIDILVAVTTAELEELFKKRGRGWTASRLWFASRRKGIPAGGLNLTKDKPQIDVDLLATGSDSYLQDVVLSALSTNLQPNLTMPVIQPEDLVVMKSLVGRDKDHDDVVAISRARKLDTKYIDGWINELL